MALDAHLTELNSKHKKLEQRLEEVMQHPSADSLEIAQLKREKLKLKDELNKLQTGR